MSLHAVDQATVLAYLALTIAVGFCASKNLDSYFLGGETLPWYMLGVSNASGMFDITGTITSRTPRKGYDDELNSIIV